MKKLLIKKWLKNYLILFSVFFLIEIIFDLLEGFTLLSWSIVRIVLFNNIMALLFSFFICFFKDKIVMIINLVLTFFLSFYAFAQLGFYNYLGVYISLNTTSQLGAVLDYINEYFRSFKLSYYLIFIPFIILIVYYLGFKRFKSSEDFKEHKLFKRFIMLIIFLLISIGTYYSSLTLKFMKNKLQISSNLELFKNPSPPSIAVKQLGVFCFGVTDLKIHFFPYKETDRLIDYEKEQSEKTDYSREIDDNAFKSVIENEKSNTYKNLHNYFINQSITPRNEYTGLFEGKNLIVIMLESVNDIIIDENLYPNFYRLYNEGWYWKNNYSPRNSCSTGNNELSGMISLYSIYNSCTANYYKNNTYFTSIFNLFNNRGYYTASMHNYTEAYYSRRKIHTNLGSQKYYGVEDLKIKYQNEYRNWSSDADFMSKYLEIVSEYDKEVPFMTWLTTVSSHQPYSVSSILGDKYLYLFNDTNYPKDLKRYMSKLKELDNGLGILLDGLENQGILNDTVIVLYGDHYPYGLSKSTINKVLEYDLEDYEVERVPFIIYNSEQDPKIFNEYTSYINILPTIANLFNLEYDPRFYMGEDLLSDLYESKVVFADGSWKNDKVYYNAATGNIINYDEMNSMSNEEIMKITNEVKTQIDISNKVIKNNYFNYLEKALKSYKNASSNEDEEKQN